MKRKFLLTKIVFPVLFFSCLLYGQEKQSAYEEKIITPHWKWEEKHKAGKVKALFLVNNLAAREPHELEQRFDLSATIVPVKGDAYANHYDEDFLRKELEKHYDVLVVASTHPWNSLSLLSREKIKVRVENGLSLIIFGRNPQVFPELSSLAEKDEILKKKVTEDIERHFPIRSLKFKTPFQVNVLKAGKGRIFLMDGYDLHWCFFTAFLPLNAPYFEGRAEPELCYGLAGWMIRYAAGKEAQLKIEAARVLTEPAEAGEKAEFELKVSGRCGDKVSLTVEVHNNAGNTLQEKVITGEEGAKEIRVFFHPLQCGTLTVLFKLKEGALSLDCAALLTKVKAPANLESIDIPEEIGAREKLKVRWVIKGTTNPSYRLSLQVYDFSGNLVSFGEASAARQGLEIPGWEPEFPHYQVRILLVDGERILDEQSRPVFVKFNREEDLRRYQVILWSNEYGSFVERFRCQIFRRLGIDALASPNPIVLKMASEEGLRMVPTNICVPPNAYKAGFNKDAEKKKLQLLVKDIYRYAPLGYSLADEPSEEGIKELKMKDLCDFRDWAAEIIHQDDKGARVGYCGVWWGLDKNVCKYFSHCDFVEAYSPFHLYTPNLWLGVERDLYRSFVRPDGLITCWTHYAPEKDLEPYSRTVPWLWLFEGLKGVSYFASAGEGFGILTNEWHSTHETRWWSEEIKEIKKGIGEQIIGMERDVGSVRILFHPSKNKSAENWAFALNRLNIPYKFICSEALEKGLDQKTKLLICPDVQEVSDVALEKIQEFTGRGGWIVISGPFAILKENKVGEAEKTKNFLGISQGSKQEDIKKWEQDLALHKAIPSKVRVVKENIAKLNLQNLAGLTTGINCIELKGARIIGEFEQLGDIKSEEKGTQPEFIKRLFLTPAITVNEFGQGKVIYLTFTPTIESAGLLLSEIGRKIELNKEIGCTIEGQEDDTVFLYPFKDREKLLVGVIQNYYRLPPSFEIAGHESELDAWESKGGKETVNYFHHGPYLWKEREGLLKVKENRYIYDVRRGLYKGFGSEVKFNLKPGNPELLAFLPYRINSLSLSLPEKLKQGEVLKVAVYLKDSSGLLRGSHVVNLELVTPENELFKSYNLHTEKGKGEKFILIPFNAPAGRWTITARDALTGMVNKKALSVEKAKTQPVFVLSKEDTRIEKVPLAWPQGNWVVYKKKEKIETPEVKLDLQPLTRKRMWISKEHSGHEYLTGSFTLTNAKMAYGISYSVCNDWKSHGWEDERKIWAPYLPGLGIVKPQSHIWYYNGYIQIFLDDFEATGYRLADIKPVESGENKRVDVLWETPRGKITLSFLMMPEHPGIFQKLSIKSDVPTKKVTVRFRSYPEGFSSPGKSFVFAEDRKRWAVLGDEINDRAFGRGRGPGAILLVPEEWTRINFDPHNTRLEKDLVADSSETNFHWVLWLFPEMTNKEAIRYMNQNADQTITKLKEVYP